MKPSRNLSDSRLPLFCFDNYVEISVHRSLLTFDAEARDFAHGIAAPNRYILVADALHEHEGPDLCIA